MGRSIYNPYGNLSYLLITFHDTCVALMLLDYGGQTHMTTTQLSVNETSYLV